MHATAVMLLRDRTLDRFIACITVVCEVSKSVLADLCSRGPAYHVGSRRLCVFMYNCDALLLNA